MDDGATTRVCEGCGEAYDFIERDVRGDFHFLVMKVDNEADGTLTVIGHWRTGIVVAGQALELRRREGQAVAIDSMTMRPPASAASGRSGQRTLIVRTSHPGSFHAGGCIRPLGA